MTTVCATSSAQWPARAFAQSMTSAGPVQQHVLGMKVEVDHRAARADGGSRIVSLADIPHDGDLALGDVTPPVTAQDATCVERVHVRVATARERL